jgi:8-oxo-dGTP pyrophosphatase MutT (NUDIX family)
LFYTFFAIIYRKIQKLLRISTLGVRAIVLNQENKILLVKHSYGAGWFLPGGGVDRNESIPAAIKRELIEEVGICIEGELKLFGCYINNIYGATDYVFLFVVSKYNQIESHSPEIAEYHWYNYDEIPEITSPGSKRRLKEYFCDVTPSEKW